VCVEGSDGHAITVTLMADSRLNRTVHWEQAKVFYDEARHERLCALDAVI
jgi:hypothetical protein